MDANFAAAGGRGGSRRRRVAHPARPDSQPRPHGARPIDHGFCQSVYFAGPEGLALELTSGGAIDDRAWIDPEVVSLAGIDQDDLARYRQPADYQRSAEPVPQPALDRGKPHLNYSDEIYQLIATASDEDLRAMLSDTEPPVKPQDRRLPPPGSAASHAAGP